VPDLLGYGGTDKPLAKIERVLGVSHDWFVDTPLYL